MRTNNFNKEGETNVKSNAELWNSDWIDSKNADVIRDESKWNAFQLMGDTNSEEMTHTSNVKMSEKEMQKVLDRGLAFRVGHKIKMMLESQNS